VVAAAVVTVSRSAQLAVLIVLAADLFFRRPKYRPVMLLVAAVGGLVFVVFREQVLDLLGAYAGEGHVGEDWVVINGVQYDYNGTRHRDLLLLAYEEAIDKAGWFGYGTNLQDMPRDPEMAIQFVSIDHHYLFQYLRYGVVGTVAFLLFALSGAWNLAREAWARDGPLSDLAAGLFGSFVAVIIMIRGVALSPDFGFTWVFVAGLAASLRARRYAAVTAPAPPS
jgi:O-antigen ligase